ncbi:MAG: FAD-dependent oxidoreductase, partial [Schleiferiaceae bacterium]
MLQRAASYWETHRTLGTFDVVVVGGGMVGLWTAFHLQQASPALRVAVVDQLPSGQTGASTRNAGFACFGSPTELLDDLRHESPKDLLTRLTWRYEGLQAWRAQFNEADLGWQPGRGYEIFDTTQTQDLEA